MMDALLGLAVGCSQMRWPESSAGTLDLRSGVICANKWRLVALG